MESRAQTMRSGEETPTAPDFDRPTAPAAERPDDDGSPAGRGGRIDFTEAADLVEEASEESFPASDPPSHSPSRSADSPGD